jgi:hypothetical protein
MPPKREPRVYTDEDIDHPLVEALRLRGFDILTAQEADRLGQPDDEQLAFAASAGRAILSYNRTDFRVLHEQFERSGETHSGIVLLPQASPLVRRVLRACMLLEWLASHPTAMRLVNWNDFQIMLHRGYRPPGYDDRDIRLVLGLTA